MKYMFLNLMLCMASLPLNMYKIELVYFHLQLKLELSTFDIMSNDVGCMVEQILGIELLDFFDHQCQISPISYHSKGAAFL